MNIVETDFKRVNPNFLSEFSMLTGLIGRRSVKEVKLLVVPKNDEIERRVPKIIKGEFKPYFDVNKHKAETIARVYQEERKDVSIEKRIVHAKPYFESQIETDNWTNNKHSKAEKEETENVFKMAKRGFDLLIWISPLSDVYEEGRLNIQLPKIKKGKEFFEGWGIPLSLNEDETMELGKRLMKQEGKTLTKVVDLESLRRQPIGFNLKDGERWLDKCEELMPEMHHLWKTIRDGKVEKNYKEILTLVYRALEKANGNNFVFEREMRDMGYRLNVSGNHGGSWLSQEFRDGIGVVITISPEGVSYKIGSTEGLTLCEKCGCWYSGDNCPCKQK